MFWFDPGPYNTSPNPYAANGTLWVVDPSVVPPVPQVYQTGVTVFLGNSAGDMESHFIVTGEIDLGTYHMSNLKMGYLFYFKEGKIWLVDTSGDPLTSRQLSNETNATAETLCSVNSRHRLDQLRQHRDPLCSRGTGGRHETARVKAC